MNIAKYYTSVSPCAVLMLRRLFFPCLPHSFQSADSVEYEGMAAFAIPSIVMPFFTARSGLFNRCFQLRLELCDDFLHAKLGLCKSALNHSLLVWCKYRHYLAEHF